MTAPQTTTPGVSARGRERGQTPCYGKSALFDSTELEDHRQAKALCETCPMLVACARLLTDVLKSSQPYGTPDGTWAAHGFGIGKKEGRSRTKFACGTEQAYQAHRYYKEPVDDACRSAHREHNRARKKAA